MLSISGKVGKTKKNRQELEIGSVQGDPLTWKSLQGEKESEKFGTFG